MHVERAPRADRSRTTLVRLACIAALAALLPRAGTGQPATPDETERWVPALSVGSGVLWQDADGSVTTGDLTGPGNPEEGVKIGPDDDDEDRMVSPFVGGSFELMTPALADGLARPRLFAHGDAAAAFSFDRRIAGVGSPGGFALPESFFFGGQNAVPEVSVLGQGTRTKAEVQTLLVGAGAGVAFTLDLWGRRVRVKPSVEYLREEIEVTGQVNRAVALVASPRDLDDFRLVSLSDSQTETFHGIGPGLEIEGDAARLGPFVLSVYLSARAWRFLGDLDLALEATNEVGETASWTFEKEPWAIGGGLGVRFRWLPE